MQHLKPHAKKLKPLTALVLKTLVPHSLSFDLFILFCPETHVSKNETTLLQKLCSLENNKKPSCVHFCIMWKGSNFYMIKFHS